MLRISEVGHEGENGGELESLGPRGAVVPQLLPAVPLQKSGLRVARATDFSRDCGNLKFMYPNVHSSLKLETTLTSAGEWIHKRYTDTTAARV